MAGAVKRTRRGLVLGGGGMLGAAWMTGALSVLSEALGWDPREAEMIVGTSAGSVLAALLGAGASAEDLKNHQLTGRLGTGPLRDVDFDYATVAGGALPERPKLALGSRQLLARSARHPRSVPPTAVFAAALPVGRGSLGGVRAMVAGLPGDGAGWSRHKALRIVALDYDAGRRTVFGAPSAPEAELADAVTASCSIPGWFAPMEIGGHRYVDGGMWSATNVDVASARNFEDVGEAKLDELYVLAPMAVRGFDGPPASVLERAVRRYRRSVTKRMLAETQRVRADGTRVVAFCPSPDDLKAIGQNMMDAGRRPAVLETSLRTPREQLDAAWRGRRGPEG
jgi:NTE family protein